MSEFVKPKPLLPGDTVGLIAPSDAIEADEIVTKIIEDWGLKVKIGKTVHMMVDDFMAGTAEQRREDLMDMIYDPEVKMIWALEGGYAATEVLPVFSRETVEYLKKNPKWFIGYSDVCVILNALTSFKMVNLQGPNFSGIDYWDDETRAWLKKILFETEKMKIENDANWKAIIPGVAEGRLVISNLDSLITTFGTKFDPLMYGTDDVILGIEEWWMDKSSIQRQLDTIMNHKKFGRVKGFILGRFAHVSEESYPGWGKNVTVEELVMLRLRARGSMPLATLTDFGHVREDTWMEEKFPLMRKKEAFFALPNGIKIRLTVGENNSLEMLESIAKE